MNTGFCLLSVIAVVVTLPHDIFQGSVSLCDTQELQQLYRHGMLYVVLDTLSTDTLFDWLVPFLTQTLIRALHDNMQHT